MKTLLKILAVLMALLVLATAHCTEDELEIMENDEIGDIYDDCSFKCFLASDDDLTKCGSACITSMNGVSLGCTACYTDFVTCGRKGGDDDCITVFGECIGL